MSNIRKLKLGHGVPLYDPDTADSDTVSASLAHTYGLPVQSPRPSQPPPQASGMPPAGISSPLSSSTPRLNSNASAFVPGHVPPQQRRNRIKITDTSGREVDLTGLHKQERTPASDKNGFLAAPVLWETEEAQLKRRTEEERQQRAKEAMWKAGEVEQKRKEEEERRQKEQEQEHVSKEEEVKANAESDTPAQAVAENVHTAAVKIKSKKESEATATVIVTLRQYVQHIRNLGSTCKFPNPPSALDTIRPIQDIYQVQYPEGIKSPKPELNTNAKDGKFRYDREFLLQFMSVCKEKPDNLPSLEAIGLEPVDQTHSMGRGGSGRRGVSCGMGPPSSTSRQGSIGLGLNTLNGKVGSGFAMGMGNFAVGMGNFAAPKPMSKERFIRATSMSGGGPGGLAFGGGHPSPIIRLAGQGGPGASGSKRTRSKRGDATRNEANHTNEATIQYNINATTPLEPVAPLEHSANRRVPGTTRRVQTVDQDSPEVVEKKVRALLDELTKQTFGSILNQIIAWANRSENEKDGRTLIQVIRLVFEKATDEVASNEIYARLCHKMMKQISPNVQDEGIRNAEGKPITGSLLFRKYLLNRCQEDFDRWWSNKETAAAALIKANEDRAVKNANANERNKEGGEEAMLYSDKYYAARKAKRQGLGLIQFIGELFKLRMLTEGIMHECIKKLLSNVDNPEEEEIESLCKLLTTVGQTLETSRARGQMDVHFGKMKELAKSNNVANRVQLKLQYVINLRERKWIPRSAAAARRHGSAHVGSDGLAVNPGPSRPTNKADDLAAA